MNVEKWGMWGKSGDFFHNVAPLEFELRHGLQSQNPKFLSLL